MVTHPEPERFKITMSQTPPIFDVYTDASVSTSSNSAGIGWLIYKQPNGGRFIQAGAKRLFSKEIRSTKYCEIRAIVKALKEIHIKADINLHCDDADVVQLINGPIADIIARQEKAKNNFSLAEAYKNLADQISRKGEVTAIKCDPDLSALFAEAHNLAQVGEQLTPKDVKKQKDLLRGQLLGKPMHITLKP